MIRSSQLSRIWRDLSITAKFILAFALLLGMLLLEAAVSFLALHSVRKAEAVILNSVEIRQHVFEMDGQLEKARRLHRDFFLQYPQIGFVAAEELYFKPSTEIISSVVALSEDLKRLIESTNVSAALRERENDLNLYLSTSRRFSDSFRDLVTLVTTLAAPGSGLESRLNDLELKLKDEAKGSAVTMLPYRLMVAHQREYMVNRQRPSMQSALNACFELRQALIAQGASSRANWPKVKGMLDQYVDIAGQIPDIDVAIRSKLNDFTLQARAVDPISAKLKTLATNEVDSALKRIDSTQKLSALVIGGTALGGLLFCLLVAWLINISVTRRILALTRSAGQMRTGNLEAHVEPSSNDELGLLASSFNDLAARIRLMVGNLEGLVAQRTSELTEAHDRLKALVVELDDKNHTLEVLSVTDRLTGLHNRRKLEDTLQSELLRARRYGKVFSVIMLDVDRFKNINDTHGHQVGDSVLVQLAAILRRNARETDIVGRYGGEEFLIICPETNIQVVTAMAERHRQELERYEFPDVGRVTASFGVTAFHEGDEAHKIIQRVDEALYRAKQTGRNRVESSSPTPATASA